MRSVWSCSEWGLACCALLPGARCALTAPFHPYLCRLFRRPSAVLLSVPLSVALPRPAVSRHSALRSPDFPPRMPCGDTRRLPETATKCGLPTFSDGLESCRNVITITRQSVSKAQQTRPPHRLLSRKGIFFHFRRPNGLNSLDLHGKLIPLNFLMITLTHYETRL